MDGTICGFCNAFLFLEVHVEKYSQMKLYDAWYCFKIIQWEAGTFPMKANWL